MSKREQMKTEILRLIARHNGEWSWYQLDRALSGAEFSPEMSELMPILQELISAGWLERRENGEAAVRYFITPAGQTALTDVWQLEEAA